MTEPMKNMMNMGEPNEGVEELPQPDPEPHYPPAPLKNQ